MAAPPSATLSTAVRAVAVFEALKGLVVLALGAGLLSFAHHDIRELAVMLVRHAHLNPASRYPHIFVDAASHLQDAHLVLLAGGAAAYAMVRFVEAYGLFFKRAWAEVLASVSGAIYVPFELIHLIRRPSWHAAAFLALNLLIVAIMVQALVRRRRGRMEERTV